MSVTSIVNDRGAKTMTLTAEFDAPLERVWEIWADPRKLERWWGPPSYPATVENHDLTPGGSVTYYMTGPEGDKPRGWWKVISADPPHHLEFEDGFADDALRGIASAVDFRPHGQDDDARRCAIGLLIVDVRRRHARSRR